MHERKHGPAHDNVTSPHTAADHEAQRIPFRIGVFGRVARKTTARAKLTPFVDTLSVNGID